MPKSAFVIENARIDVVGMQIIELQHDVRKQRFVPLGVGIHLQQPDRVNRRQPHAADHLVPHLLHAVFDVAERLQDLAAAVVINLAGGRELKGPLRTVDQPAAEPRSSMCTAWLADDCET